MKVREDKERGSKGEGGGREEEEVLVVVHERTGLKVEWGLVDNAAVFVLLSLLGAGAGAGARRRG